jgi:hypothetical protein
VNAYRDGLFDRGGKGSYKLNSVGENLVAMALPGTNDTAKTPNGLFQKLAKKHASDREPIPDDVRMFVRRRDEGRCVRCGSDHRLEYDHIIPIAQGGSNTEPNIQLLCETCNRAKGGFDLMNKIHPTDLPAVVTTLYLRLNGFFTSGLVLHSEVWGQDNGDVDCPAVWHPLPLSPERAERHGFEYYRHGTLSLLAALDTQSGEVLAETVPRHTSAAFVAFLGDIVATQPPRREIHVIADNLSTQKTQAVRTFLLEHPNVHLHFHADLFVVAQSSRTLVCEDRTPTARPRRLHVRRGPRSKDSSLHSALQQNGETDSLELSNSRASHW